MPSPSNSKCRIGSSKGLLRIGWSIWRLGIGLRARIAKQRAAMRMGFYCSLRLLATAFGWERREHVVIRAYHRAEKRLNSRAHSPSACSPNKSGPADGVETCRNGMLFEAARALAGQMSALSLGRSFRDLLNSAGVAAGAWSALHSVDSATQSQLRISPFSRCNPMLTAVRRVMIKRGPSRSLVALLVVWMPPTRTNQQIAPRRR